MSKSITPLMDARLTAEGAERGRLKAAAERDTLRAEVERLQRELATAHADASHYASSAEDMRAEVERLQRELQEERGIAESVRFSAWRHGDFLAVRELLGMFCTDGVAGVDQEGMECVAKWAAQEFKRLSKQAARYERLRRLNPRQFAEIHQRNLAGERFDDLLVGGAE